MWWKRSISLFFRSVLVGAFIGTFLFSLHKLYHFWTRPSQERSLSLFVWGDYFDPVIFSDFEKQYGIHIIPHYYTTNEELLIAMEHSKGEGYDVLLPSDYAVALLREKEFLQVIDKDRITRFSEIEPLLLGHKYDPNNEFSIPYTWEVLLVGIDQSMYQTHAHSYDALFPNAKTKYHVVMTPDPLEAINLASIYLFGSPRSLNEEEIGQVQNILSEQRGHIEAYADFRAKYLLSTRNCPIALIKSSLLNQVQKENPDILYYMPDDGVLCSIENISLSKHFKDLDAAYLFINFLYKRDNQRKTLMRCPQFPAILDALQGTLHDTDSFCDILDQLRTQNVPLHLIDFLMPPETLHRVWINIKSGQ